jgi:hypothetical protein
LDLKNFHQASHGVSIVPILIATGATASAPLKLHVDEDMVYRPIPVCPPDLREVINMALRTITGEIVDRHQWSRAPYHPTPTIVEARGLFTHNIRSKPLRVTTQEHRIYA